MISSSDLILRLKLPQRSILVGKKSEMINTLYMHNDYKSTPLLAAKRIMRPLFLHIPVDCVNQLDILARYYGKTRVALIRDILQKGLQEMMETYSDHQREATRAQKVFDEMDRVATIRDFKIKDAKTSWEDSYK